MQCLGDIAGDHAVNNLYLFQHFAVLDYFQTGTLNNQIILATVKQILSTDLGNKLARPDFSLDPRYKGHFHLSQTPPSWNRSDRQE